MSESFRPYADYRDSGLPWLGAIPSHWEVGRNGRLFAQRNETRFAELPILEVSLKTGVRVRDMDNLKRKQMMSDREKYKRAAQGDIAYNMMRMWQGAVGVAPVDGLVSPAYVVARPYAGTEPRYFSYLFRTIAYMNEVDGYSRGIVKDRNRLYWADFKRMPSCVPPPEEQVAIADFLDAHAAKVRRFIRNRRRLIEVLNEQKRAVISRAVTRGLDPDVALKPSGDKLLGGVPEHWVPVRLGLAIDLLTGFPFKSSGFTDASRDVRLLRGINVSPGRIRWDSTVRWPASEAAAHQAYALREGDVVIGMDRPVIRGGVRVAQVRERDLPSLLLQRVARLRARSELEQGYLLLLLSDRRYSDYLAPIFTGISVPHISPSQIANYRVALPPIEEQRKIVAMVREKTREVSVAIDCAEREIDLVREYQTCMITEVVTGKIDVRHLAAELPDELTDDLVSLHCDLDDDLAEDEAELVAELVDADD